ncbi:hypothetical protein [Rhodovulum steppense]|uniref:Uncharacterized protein n=1 Tax=Rhodovulum steppense TaxID=540251 RepID=A0A4V2R5D1_9RHOB|nr:hypothetical protein [Rhodovulum steppense]TCM88074.1 hypothetical protein EV216_10184 [Rhodovulum steppense]
MSSIRRIVTDEAPGLAGARAADAPERLILTQAQRVGPPAGDDAPGAWGGAGRESSPPVASGPGPVAAETSSLEQRIAELEAAFAGCDDEWEPDGTETLVAATGWSTPVPAGSAPGLPDGSPRGGGMSGPGVVLDEEALRDLVAAIVRQELEGDLGERMSQNVRKLVRREISRALTVRERE